jgi:hypothetical protein
MNRPGGRSAARGAGPCRAQLEAFPNCQYLHGDRDANGQTLAYVYGHADERDAELSKFLTLDDARRLAANIAKVGYWESLVLLNESSNRAARERRRTAPSAEQLEAPRKYHWNFPRQRGALRTVGLFSRLGCLLHGTQPDLLRYLKAGLKAKNGLILT